MAAFLSGTWVVIFGWLIGGFVPVFLFQRRLGQRGILSLLALIPLAHLCAVDSRLHPVEEKSMREILSFLPLLMVLAFMASDQPDLQASGQSPLDSAL